MIRRIRRAVMRAEERLETTMPYWPFAGGLAVIVLLILTSAYAAPIVCDRFGCRATGTHVDANGNSAKSREVTVARARGYCFENTAAGSIIINCAVARQMVGFINDVVARGFKGRVHCFALGGHVRNSFHYSAKACDFAQRGRGKTVRPMYHVADLAAKWGLRDGCTFQDCGHIDAGRGVIAWRWPGGMAMR